VGANESVRVWSASADRLGPAADRVLTVRSGAFPANRHFFAAIKDLPCADSAPRMRVERRGAHTLQATITAADYLYGVRLEAPHPATHYSDNCFDLMAGETRAIVVRNAEVEMMPADLSVRTLLRHA
jgi:beta-mannosidase